MVALDIEKSTETTNPEKAANRQTMYEIFEESLIAGGIQRSDRNLVDWGDGVLALIRPVDRAPKVNLLRATIPTLEKLLGKHNAEQDSHLRLRVAVHAGEVHRDSRGWYGEAIDVVFRLINSKEARMTLRNNERTIALIVSSEIQHAVIRHKYFGIDPAEFYDLFSVHVHDADYHGWLHCPYEESTPRIEFVESDHAGR
ncbi:hypothetical protein Q5425_03010 [Amycolatopsis sp. A133]|uniref:hypothetical protein n=1 Tax=Amycolatopsis sp. A133 TaxID=3064472 RepID=UPI0027F07CE3|nr:hypothetical protein [Amycolatopsis sp. A133]MDQ7802685.1 hypothetical protein [Amycolatopsis sp. A133]